MSSASDVEYVLDASALLAYLNSEPGGETVESKLTTCAISSVNLCEVFQASVKRGVDIEGLQSDLIGLHFRVIKFDVMDSYYAASLWSQTAGLGLSLGDRACLSLARQEEVPALTADRTWKKIKDVGVEIVLIR